MAVSLRVLGTGRSALVALIGGCLTSWGAAAFDLQGHRGARGLAPENTIAGFEEALRLGVHTLELDVVLSAEGVPIISHDPQPNPDITRDASGQWLREPGPPFHTLTLEEIAALDVGRIRPESPYAQAFPEQRAIDGERIPTLSALLERIDALASTVRLNIELKRDPRATANAPEPERFVQAVLNALDAHGMRERSSLQSFDWRLLQIAARLGPDVKRVFLSAQRPSFNTLETGEWTGGARLNDHRDAPAMVAAAGGQIWSPHHRDLDPGVLRRARAEGLRVIPWTVNEPADMARLIEWGVDGIITDHPQRLRGVMRQRGMPLPVSGIPQRPRSTSRTTH